MPVRQLDDMGVEADLFQAQGELVGSLPPGLVVVLIEGDIDKTARLIGELRHLRERQLRADRAGCIAEAGLPQHGQIEQSVHQDHGGESAHCFPGEQGTLGARQQTVRERRADTCLLYTSDAAAIYSV